MRIQKIIFVLLAMNFIFLLRILYAPHLFADFESYYSIINNLKNSSDSDTYEWLSYGTIKFVSGQVNDVYESIYWLYIINLIIFTCGMLLICVNSNVSIGGVLLVLSVYSPLLVFVTLRASPAYLLVAYSIIMAIDKRKIISLLISFVAIFYHVTAIIPFVVILIVNLKIEFFKRNLNAILILIYFLFIFQLLNFIFNFGIYFNEFAKYIGLLEYIGKYSIYFEVDKSFGVVHYLYYIFVFLLFLVTKYYSALMKKEFIIYFYAMMLVYSAMMISPVAAYRISIFFLIPLCLLVPWDDILRGWKSYFYFIFSPVIFIFSYYGVIVK